MIPRRAIVALLASAALLTVPVSARAAALPGPGTLSLGLGDGTLFEQSAPSTQSFWLGRARALGSTLVRLDASWDGIAPNHPPPGFNAANPGDPSYDWSKLDENVRAASAHGLTVLLLAFAAPTWASGPDRPAGVNPEIWLPNASDFGAFAHALALRYSGHFPDPLHRGRDLPRVRYFQAWNEPNLPEFLMPQWSRASAGPWEPVSPGIYRSLLNSFYAAVKSVQPASVVLAAGTAPYGDPPGTGLGRMAPVTFLDGLLCLTPALGPKPCADPPHFDALDHHPYSLAPTLPARSPNDISLADIDKIGRILRAAQRLHRALPAGPKSIWTTEIHWTSSPPNTPALQARYLALSFYELWRQGVSHVMWFYMRDPTPSDGDGLYDTAGAAKPAAAAFRFPFVALRAPRGQLTLWGRAPRPGTVSIQKLTRGRWRQVVALPTTHGGVFYAVRSLGLGLRWRAVSHGTVSPVWATG